MIAEKLAQFAAAPVRNAAEAHAVLRLSLLDWAACGIAGHREPVAEGVRKLVIAEAGREEATLFGGGRVPARAAALHNGAASHALDYDDTHFAHIGHPSVAVLPAALAVAESQGTSMADFLDAALIGVEASIRVGIWLGRGHYQAGFHQTATAGAFGAALASARLLGLPPDKIAQALALVSTRASGLKSQFGTDGKPLNAGIAATNGVEAALLAGAGFRSRSGTLDGPQGFGPTHQGAAVLSAFDRLGADWLFTTVSHKFHACCHGLHAMLEALASATGDIESVAVTAHPRWAKVCNIEAPATGLEAKFSFRFAAALRLAGYDTAALATWSEAALADPKVSDLAGRVSIAFDPGISETAAHVRVAAGGRTTETAHDLTVPMSLDDRAAKVRAKAAALIGPDRAARIDVALNARDASALAAAIT